MSAKDPNQDFGANEWLVDEMYEQYRIDPTAVSDTWREFFSDYTPGHAGSVPGVAAPAAAPTPEQIAAAAAAAAALEAEGNTIRGPAPRKGKK